MSLEYAIELPCPIRQELGEQKLREMGRTSALVSRIVNETIETAATPSRESVQLTTENAKLLEAVDQISAFCQLQCPGQIPQKYLAANEENKAAVAPRLVESIHCLGRIRYPIEAKFERFLADRLQLLYDTLATDEWPRILHVLLDAESPFDGEGTKELRRVTTPEGLRFFERRVPIPLARNAGQLSTDNVFDILAGFSAGPEVQVAYQRELPILALSDYADFLEALLLSEEVRAEWESLEMLGNNYAEFVQFTRAIRIAQKLEVRLLLE